MIEWLAPGMLGLLAGLAIPLLIHLQRRGNEHPILFAALRWLRANERRQRRPRLRDLPLLLARLALLAVLAVLLASPQWIGTRSEPDRVAVIPGADWQPARSRWPDARWPDAHWHWLAPGWPSISQPPPAAGATASLLRQLDHELPPGTALHVLAPNELGGLDGGAIVLSRPVDWVVTTSETPSAGPSQPPAGQPVAIRTDPGDTRSTHLLTQALLLNGLLTAADAADIGDPQNPVASANRYLLWFTDAAPTEQVMAWVQAGGTLLRLCPPTTCTPLAAADSARPIWRSRSGQTYLSAAAWSSGRVLQLHGSLDARNFPEWFDADFPQRLRGWLLPPKPGLDRAPAASAAPTTARIDWQPLPLSLRPWLLGLLLSLLLIERTLAWRRALRGAQR